MKRTAPAVARNREPLLARLKQLVPSSGVFVEIASGTGEHCVYFAEHFRSLTFFPSDVSDENLASIEAWRLESGLENIKPARRIDATAGDWGVGQVDVVFCANMIHIAPPVAMQGLMRGSARHLKPHGLLVTYGPYKMQGRHTAESNERFEEWLRAEDPRYGVRDLDELTTLAAQVGLSFDSALPMPANNYTLVFRQEGGVASDARTGHSGAAS